MERDEAVAGPRIQRGEEELLAVRERHADERLRAVVGLGELRDLGDEPFAPRSSSAVSGSGGMPVGHRRSLRGLCVPSVR